MLYFILSDENKPFAIITATNIKALKEKIFEAFKDEVAEELEFVSIDFRGVEPLQADIEMDLTINYINEEGEENSDTLYLIKSVVY